VRVAISGSVLTMPFANVFWCNLTGGSTATQAALDAWLTSFCAGYVTGFNAAQTTDVLYKQGQATLFQNPPNALHSTHVMTGGGTRAGATVADSAAAVVASWATTAYWRGGKPRNYLPGLLPADLTLGHQLTSAADTLWTNAVTSFLSVINAISATGITQTSLGMVSFFSQNAPRPTPLFFPYLSGQVHGRIGTQRRRLGPWLP